MVFSRVQGVVYISHHIWTIWDCLNAPLQDGDDEEALDGGYVPQLSGPCFLSQDGNEIAESNENNLNDLEASDRLDQSDPSTENVTSSQHSLDLKAQEVGPPEIEDGNLGEDRPQDEEEKLALVGDSEPPKDEIDCLDETKSQTSLSCDQNDSEFPSSTHEEDLQVSHLIP